MIIFMMRRITPRPPRQLGLLLPKQQQPESSRSTGWAWSSSVPQSLASPPWLIVAIRKRC